MPQLAKAPGLDHERLAAPGTGLAGLFIFQLHLLGRFRRFVKVFLERFIKILDYARPFPLLVRDIIELAFHIGGKLNIDDIREVQHEKVVHNETELGGLENAFRLRDIFTFLNRRNGGA